MRWDILSYILIVYGLLTCVIYFVSDFAIFPAPSASYEDTRLGQMIKKLTTADGKIITAVYLPNPKASFTLLISHGNGEDLGNILPWLMAFYQHGFSVLGYDYHGYGTSGGFPSEKNTYRDIDAAYDYLIKTLNISPSQVIIFGRSLGSGPSIDLASHKPCGGVIIESGFLSAFRVFTYVPLFPVDKYANYLKIKKIHVPMLFIHGTQDEVIPFWHGDQLYQLANTPKEFFWVKGGLHNNVPEKAGKAYFEVITKFTHSIERVSKGF